MRTLPILIVLLTLSSCSLFSPNPNREGLLSDAPMELKPFTTDYCSDFPNGTSKNPMQWADCCFSHDLHYWIGGTEAERKSSDVDLKACVKNTGASFDSFLMYMGVRMGGKPGNASYSWGYGWTVKRDYIQLPASDIDRGKVLLKESGYYQTDITRKLIDEFIENVLEKRIQTN